MKKKLLEILNTDKHIKFNKAWKLFFICLFLTGIYMFASCYLKDIIELTKISKRDQPIFYPIIIGIILYAIKIIISGLIHLRNRSHTLKGLQAYLSLTTEFLKGKHDIDFELKKFELKLENDANFIPYPTFDNTQGFLVSDIVYKFSYLDGESVKRLTDFINKEKYAISVMEALHDSRVIEMGNEDKLDILERFLKSRKNWYKSAKKAQVQIEITHKFGPLDWILNFLYLPRVLVEVTESFTKKRPAN